MENKINMSKEELIEELEGTRWGYTKESKFRCPSDLGLKEVTDEFGGCLTTCENCWRKAIESDEFKEMTSHAKIEAISNKKVKHIVVEYLDGTVDILKKGMAVELEYIDEDEQALNISCANFSVEDLKSTLYGFKQMEQEVGLNE